VSPLSIFQRLPLPAAPASSGSRFQRLPLPAAPASSGSRPPRRTRTRRRRPAPSTSRTSPRPDRAAPPLDEKLRQAYFWIVNTAIISPHYDVEYNGAPPQSYAVGDGRGRLTLPSRRATRATSCSPDLRDAAKCLFVGGPGRGKTASAILMGVIAGYSVRDVRRAMQHGHPQMTIATCSAPRCRRTS
jgi:hypothetical protein